MSHLEPLLVRDYHQKNPHTNLTVFVAADHRFLDVFRGFNRL